LLLCGSRGRIYLARMAEGKYGSIMKVVVLHLDRGVSSVFYRAAQPYGHLRDVQGKDMAIYNLITHDKEQLRNGINLADIVIFLNPYSESEYKLIKAIMGRKDKDQITVADYDDDPFNVGPWNPAYDKFGTKEVGDLHLDKEQVDVLMPRLEEKHRDLLQMNPDGSAIVHIWKDKHENFIWKGKSEKPIYFDIEDNLIRLKRVQNIMREVDLLTAATLQLANELRKYRPEGKITVMPNLIDFERHLPMKKINDGKLRIVWQGGSSHYIDLTMVKNELISFAKEHPEIEYVFQGAKFPAIFHEIKDRVKWIPWHEDINTYPLSLRELSGDIAICPLTEDAFNYGKSPLKWEEMSAMKVPCVCSPTVYGNFIEHGKTGFIARQGEWGTYLGKLLEPDLREMIGQNAYDEVKTKFSLENAAMYWSAIEDLFS